MKAYLLILLLTLSGFSILNGQTTLQRFDGAGKLDLPVNTFILQEKEGSVYDVGTKERILLLGAKRDPEMPFWTDLWLYTDKGNLENEMIYKLPDIHSSAGAPALSLTNFHSMTFSEVLISSQNPGSGGLVNLLIISCFQGYPQPIFDSEKVEFLKFKGKYLDNYQAELILPDSSKTMINLKKRKKMYQDMNIYKGKRLNEPVELWGEGPVDYKITKDQSGNPILFIYQEVRGSSNADRIALIESRLQYTDKKWKLLEQKVKAYK